MKCPCGTGLDYKDCCEPLHLGVYPENALQLMRSRYSAYALHQVDYIIRTTHRDNPQNRQAIIQFCQNTEFEKLVILDFVNGIERAEVEFIAFLKQNKRPFQLRERSLFIKEGPQWLYLQSN